MMNPQCVNLVKFVVLYYPVFVTKGLLSSGRGPMSRGSWGPVDILVAATVLAAYSVFPSARVAYSIGGFPLYRPNFSCTRGTCTLFWAYPPWPACCAGLAVLFGATCRRPMFLTACDDESCGHMSSTRFAGNSRK